MKICITSTGKEIEAKIDPRFGRAPYFFIIDTDTDAMEVVDNSAVAESQGAGIGAAQLVSDKGVDAVLTGRVGPNASTAFKASGVKLYEGVSSQETVKEALTRFKKGEYDDSPAPAGVSPRGQGAGRGLGRGMGGGGGQGQGGR
ncbi:MAG: NifB/NifX family molybdenum-iron cluster-binding protein [Desulfobacterales bacterium]|nr:NifB/NifX family molybdenum-iron cluster-binding protein [Desulfobacterales bacterium]MDX2508318.1 NifB/NifX family molybdenum-iron cluster-binding protein [Desulfobacterales bacterium]